MREDQASSSPAIQFQRPTKGALSKPTGTELASKIRLIEGYGKLPLSFEPNQGQTDTQVRFLSRGPGYSMFLTPTAAVLALRAEGVKEHGLLARSRESAAISSEVAQSSKRAILRMELIGANPNAKISGIDALPGKVNYFRGNNSKQWRAGIPTYAKVKYEQIYPGIDLVYYGNQRQLEYDFVIAPEADPDAIRLAFRGADKAEIDAQGDLVLRTALGELRLRNPLVYQDVDGGRREVNGQYMPHPTDGEAFGIHVAAYDRGRPLVIDPVLVYSTFLGGGAEDAVRSIAVDSSGNAYVAGVTFSQDFPTVDPLQPAFGGAGEAFVAKLNSAGNALVYATFLGGTSTEIVYGIAVDAAENAYVTGQTQSTDFPTVNPLQPALGGGIDAFVAKLNSTGSALAYSTYLGGFGFDPAYSVAVDSMGSAYVAGATNSPDFPTANPLQPALGDSSGDAFVAKLNPAGSALVYATFLGGTSTEIVDGIAVDASGNAYVTGITYSQDFPTANPLQPTLLGGADVFVTKLNAAGSALVYSTYLGGSSLDEASSVAVDGSENAYVAGTTLSADFPTVNPLQPTFAGIADAFVTKLNPAGSALVYSTYLGGSGNEAIPREGGSGIAVDSAGNAYVTGQTSSQDFPTVNPLQSALFGSDAFVTKLNPAGSALVYSTYLGGIDVDTGFGVAVDASGNAYVTGQTQSTDFPAANALQPFLNGSMDAFVAKIADTSPPPPQPSLSVTPDSRAFGAVTVGSSKDLEFTVTNTGGGTLTGTASTSAPFSIVSGGTFSLGAGESQLVVVRFSPTAPGTFGGNVSFATNAGNDSKVVTGTGEAAPAINVTPTSLNFGSVAVGTSADRTFTIQNSGGGTLQLTCSTAAPFRLPAGCAFSLTAGQAADVTVRFSPSTTGPASGEVSFSSNGGPALVSLQGEGIPDARGRLQFSAQAYQVVENEGSVIISVTRTGGARGPATVQFATSPDSPETAIAGKDYVAQSGALSWADGDTGTKTIVVPIINLITNEPQPT